LIVIPSTLFGNWLQEVVQHVDLDANLNIKIYIARTGFDTTPVARRNTAHDTFFQADVSSFLELITDKDHSNKIFLGTPHFIAEMSNNSIYSVFDIVVIDEYHDIGKHDSTLYKALRAMAARAMVVSLSRTLMDVGIARVVPLMLVN